LNEILSQFGIDRRRVRLTWVGASEGQEFAATVNNFINDLRELGPLETRGLAAL